MSTIDLAHLRALVDAAEPDELRTALPELIDRVEEQEATLVEARKHYLLVADAIARSSNGPEDLADEVRCLRKRAEAAEAEVERLRASVDRHHECLRHESAAHVDERDRLRAALADSIAISNKFITLAQQERRRGNDALDDYARDITPMRERVAAAEAEAERLSGDVARLNNLAVRLSKRALSAEAALRTIRAYTKHGHPCVNCAKCVADAALDGLPTEGECDV